MNTRKRSIAMVLSVILTVTLTFCACAEQKPGFGAPATGVDTQESGAASSREDKEQQSRQEQPGQQEQQSQQEQTGQPEQIQQEQQSQSEQNQQSQQSQQGQQNQPQGSQEKVDLAAELAEIEKEALSLKQKMLPCETGGLLEAQDEESLSSEMLKLWDDELNLIWDRLKKSMSEEEMSDLTGKEREWISDKEEERKAMEEKYKGYVLATAIVSQREAVRTRERVYELAGILGKKYGQEIPLAYQDLYAGYYADTQGTTSVYSDLMLCPAGEEGSYLASIGIYRLTMLIGTVTVIQEESGAIKLSFESDPEKSAKVKGALAIQDGNMTFIVTESEFTYLSAGDTFQFPERLF